MAADFSRVRLNPLLDYAGVELKQGGVVLDGDVNELVGVIDRRLRALASDTLGRATVSSVTPDAFQITVADGVLQIGKGRMYVDGLLAENHGPKPPAAGTPGFDSLLAETTFNGPVTYPSQPWLPSPPELPEEGRHLVYLDVWNRELTHLEQPDLVENAVGVETSSRLQTVWQVRVHTEPNVDAALACDTPDASLYHWAALIRPSSGVLTTGTFDSGSPDPCELPPTGGYRGLENQLYRVEIHDPGRPGTATFKWSRENASVGSRVAAIISTDILELDTLGRDDVLRISSGDWVEICDDASEFAQVAGQMCRVTVDEATRRIMLTPPLAERMHPDEFPDSDLARTRNMRVRRWDQQGAVFRIGSDGLPEQVRDLDDPRFGGVIQVPASDTLLLENGVTVSFGADAGGGFKAGDHWEFAARTADASVEPLERAPPRGIHHHYARLGIWDATLGRVEDCRHPWPAAGASAASCACTHCVTPESHASGVLTIQKAVDAARDSGGTVCLQAGLYRLDLAVNIENASSIRITGQGPATILLCSEGAFDIDRCAAIGIDELAVVSVTEVAAIRVRSVLGLTLRKLAVLAPRASAVVLSGLVAGATIESNTFMTPVGVRARPPSPSTPPAPPQAPEPLVVAALRIENNVFLCENSGVRLAGAVAHVFQTRICGNHVLGCHSVGLSTEGLALPGASIDISNNHLELHGAGIRCAAAGVLIQGNSIRAQPDDQGNLAGAGIELVTGLDKAGAERCQVLANQLDGFPEAGILIAAPMQALVVKQNLIEQCGNGILMTPSARADTLAVENNQIRNIGMSATTTHREMTCGISLGRTESATVAGNILHRIGMQTSETNPVVVAIAAFSVRRACISSNNISQVGPPEDGAWGRGIMVVAPYAHADVGHNQVERDTPPTQMGRWSALHIHDPSTELVLSRLGGHTTLRMGERTLVARGSATFVDTSAARGASATVVGNVFIAPGGEPAVDVSAGGEVLFNANRCELGPGYAPTVRLATPIAIISANRIRDGGHTSISVRDGGGVRITAIANITTGSIEPELPLAMAELNLTDGP